MVFPSFRKLTEVWEAFLDLLSNQLNYTAIVLKLLLTTLRPSSRFRVAFRQGQPRGYNVEIRGLSQFL